jgi:hypothetical protein
MIRHHRAGLANVKRIFEVLALKIGIDPRRVWNFLTTQDFDDGFGRKRVESAVVVYNGPVGSKEFKRWLAAQGAVFKTAKAPTLRSI